MIYIVKSTLTLDFASLPWYWSDASYLAVDSIFISNVGIAIAAGFDKDPSKMSIIEVEVMSRRLSEAYQRQMQGFKLKVKYELVTPSLAEAKQVQAVLADPAVAASFSASVSKGLVKMWAGSGHEIVLREVISEAANVTSKTESLERSASPTTTITTLSSTTPSGTSDVAFNTSYSGAAPQKIQAEKNSDLGPDTDICKGGCTLQCPKCVGAQVAWAGIASIGICMCVCLFRGYQSRLRHFAYGKKASSNKKAQADAKNESREAKLPTLFQTSAQNQLKCAALAGAIPVSRGSTAPCKTIKCPPLVISDNITSAEDVEFALRSPALRIQEEKSCWTCSERDDSLKDSQQSDPSPVQLDLESGHMEAEACNSSRKYVCL